jgi:trk system potassium uptake protein TrkH
MVRNQHPTTQEWLAHHQRLVIRAFTRPGFFLIATFGVLILLGTSLLALPASHASPDISWLDAAFTATSAVCVTGLIVRDTGGDFSLFGQCVILALIQLGGLGIMTYAALILQLAGAKLSFRSQAALHDVFYQRSAASQFQRNLKWIVVLTFAIEAIGLGLLLLLLPHDWPEDQRFFIALFHSVSAFCNAGFSTFGDSLIGLKDHTSVIAVMSILIILGGLGYSVLIESISQSWRRLVGRRTLLRWSLNSRVVLAMSGLLIVGGMAVLMLSGLQTYAPSIWTRLGDATFQSITARTAGFNTVDLSQAPLAALLWLIALMFIGGSPGSCAGGVKTTSIAIWLARLRARARLHEDVVIGNRRIPSDLVRRTGLLLGIAAVYNLVGIMLLTATETAGGNIQLHDVIFEQISAFATVGLSTGITPELSTIGRLWIMLTMFVGRLGPITIALTVTEPSSTMVRLPEERMMIG